MTISLEGFKAWVKEKAEKTPNARIEHGTWQNCAWGKYIHDTDPSIYFSERYYIGRMAYEHLGNDNALTLGNACKPDTPDLSTYAKLHRWLEDIC